MPYLSLAIWVPIFAGLAVLAVGRDRDAALARWIALAGAIAGLVVTLPLWLHFQVGTSDMQFVEYGDWIPRFDIHYFLGVDGISMLFVLLNSLMTLVVVWSAWEVIKVRVAQYMAAFLIQSGLINGAFSALDGILFYMFFEAMLIPMYLIIGAWGGPNRVYAAVKFFLYTLLGSLLMLLAIMAMYGVAGTTDITVLLKTKFPESMQTWLWLAFFASFAVKMPMWPVHTWLPDAHVEAPTAGSVVLAAVLLKMGGYGFIRFSLPMFPDASVYFTPLIYTLSIIAIIYTSLVALVQEDMKKLIAYSSVAHMGFVTMGLFAMNAQGVEGAVFQMISHGIVSAALFLCVGVVYDRMHTRDIAAYGGLVQRMPRYAVAFMVFTLANVGLPGTSGFIGEFLTLIGAFQANSWVAFLATTGVILSAAYALYLYRRVIFGVIEKPNLMGIADLSAREIAILAPLVVLTIYYGIHPQPIIDASAASAEALIKGFDQALALTRTAGL